MAFTFQNLDSVTRKYMLQELDLDIANGNTCLAYNQAGPLVAHWFVVISHKKQVSTPHDVV